MTFEVSPGRVVGVTEFATLFSITTTDEPVSPAAQKPGAPPAPASGADFSNPSVGPLDTPDRPEASGPLPLLSQEFLPNWNTNFAEPTLLVNPILNLGGGGLRHGRHRYAEPDGHGGHCRRVAERRRHQLGCDLHLQRGAGRQLHRIGRPNLPSLDGLDQAQAMPTKWVNDM